MIGCVCFPRYTQLHRASQLSPNGRCATFDASADGFARGEGCVAVVLRPEAVARREGENILAIVRATGVNNDGRSASLPSPSGPAQQALIRDTLASAGVRPHQVSYVETHGSGSTPLFCVFASVYWLWLSEMAFAL